MKKEEGIKKLDDFIIELLTFNDDIEKQFHRGPNEINNVMKKILSSLKEFNLITQNSLKEKTEEAIEEISHLLEPSREMSYLRTSYESATSSRTSKPKRQEYYSKLSNLIKILTEKLEAIKREV